MCKNYLVILNCLVVRSIVSVSSCAINVPLNFQYKNEADETATARIILKNCISDSSFGNKSPVFISIENEEIIRMERNSVSNMSNLEGLMISNCETQVIEPGAFQNVPNLRNIDITNGSVKEIPKGIFDGLNLISLHLDYNEIFVIDDHAFANMPTLSIFLDHNQLSYFKREWFTNTTQLQALGFSYNSIRRLPTRAFDGFRNLLWLYLSHNEISVIYPDAFEGITKLDLLDLNHNRLTTIAADVFPDKMLIQFLNIGSNLINYLPNELLRKIVVEKVHIGGNPFKCPCLERIYFWFYYVGVRVASTKECSRSDIPVCIFSEHSPKTCTESVDEDLTKKFLSRLGSLETPVPVNCARYQDNYNIQWLHKTD